MSKVDYKKELKQFYAGKVNTPVTVVVPKMNYIMIDGKGDPNNSQEYIDAIQTLYPLAYTIKFISKIKYDNDFAVMPLEGLWWTKDIEHFSEKGKDEWLWTAMIMQPDIITTDIYDQAIQQIKEKKSLQSIDKVRFASYDEGVAAQVLYVGPYATEGPTIQNLHAFIKEQGGVLNKNTKHHHEIYLSDPRRSEPAKLKTIIRQPYQK